MKRVPGEPHLGMKKAFTVGSEGETGVGRAPTDHPGGQLVAFLQPHRHVEVATRFQVRSGGRLLLLCVMVETLKEIAVNTTDHSDSWRLQGSHGIRIGKILGHPAAFAALATEATVWAFRRFFA